MCVRCVFVCVCMTFNKRLIVYTLCKLNKDKSTFPLNFVCENKRYRWHMATLFATIFPHRLVVLWELFRTSMLYICIWGYSSVVEHSTADREVRGSTPRVPFHFADLHHT